jgi:hypothetical protein
VKDKCLSVLIKPTTKTTWTDQDANPGILDERPATNRLNHGMAKTVGTPFICVLQYYTAILSSKNDWKIESSSSSSSSKQS